MKPPTHTNQCSSKLGNSKKQNKCMNCYDCYIDMLLTCIQPNTKSQENRLEILDYISRLIEKYDMKPHLFGSVGLKTYIPQGDIDITVEAKHESFYKFFEFLLNQTQLKPPKHRIRNVSLVAAEIHLIKLTVDNVPVDISLNQVGGVETLNFLEYVDKIIGKDHLFKKSLILLKAWAYYESHILGSSNHLMSTYCITCLLINVFYLYKSELKTPLSVLATFLEYYAQYDWNNSLIIPDFDYCKLVDVKNVPTKVVKFMNVYDPLRSNNNVGKSISFCNFGRIKRSFVKGSEDLNQILKDKVHTHILTDFFKNTWRENGEDVHCWNNQSDITLLKNLINLSPRK